MNNVIQFPKIKREKSSVDLDYLEFLTEDITQDLVEFLYDEGYDVSDQAYIFEVSMMYESLKSLLYKMNNEYHPMQKFANNVYSAFYDRDKDEEIEVPVQLEFDFYDEDM